MKKSIMLIAALFAASCLSIQAQSPEAKKIAKAASGAAGPCYTESGERGTLYPTSRTVTTSSSSSNSQTYNSGQRASSSSSNAGFGLSNGMPNGSVGASQSSSYSSGTKSNTGTANSTTSTTTNYICVPNSKQ
ncbi:MAG: hypothetical protein K2L78_03490 [Muribaculaceae bacterium]|nr:hypothetical protein [Muribaculaceae bacterium]